MLKEVTRQEVTQIFRNWKRGTVPGPSGIPHDFFKEFRHTGPTGLALTETIRLVMSILIQPEVYNVKVPRKSLLGTIKVMYKKGDKTDIKNYRPLSMTESLYKMFTSIINNRLAEPLTKCLGKHQTGFLKKRLIYDNVKEAQALWDLAKLESKPMLDACQCSNQTLYPLNKQYWSSYGITMMTQR